MKSHKDLFVYKRAMLYVKTIYEFTTHLPVEERFGLTSQLRRAAVSVPSNIAEGATRQHNKEFIQFLYIALSSLSEIETQIELTALLGFVSQNDISKILDENATIRRMLLKLIQSKK